MRRIVPSSGAKLWCVTPQVQRGLRTLQSAFLLRALRARHPRGIAERCGPGGDPGKRPRRAEEKPGAVALHPMRAQMPGPCLAAAEMLQKSS